MSGRELGVLGEHAGQRFPFGIVQLLGWAQAQSAGADALPAPTLGLR
jgi:hypothetical protein